MTDRPVARAPSPSSTGPTVYLHVGTMKTGTTFLQQVLERNAERLEDDGVRFPLDDTRWALQVRAARDILGIRGRPTDGAWADVVDRIHAWPGRAAVVSMEFLSLASRGRVQRIVAGLAPLHVQVIITARDLARILPSAWQSMVKQGDPWSFDEFVASVTGNGEVAPDAHRRFWRHHDLPTIAAKWIAAVGAVNVHLVTVPPPDAPPELLWERFCAVLGIDPEAYDVSQDRGSNPSLSLRDSELMRHVSAELRPDLGPTAFKRWATDFFANRVLRPPVDDAPQQALAHLNPAAYSWAVERSREMVDQLRGLQLPVVGELSDLVPADRGPAAALGPGHLPAKLGGSAPVRTEPYPESTAHIVAALLRRIAEVDPQLAARAVHDDEFQRPDDAADLDEAAEAAATDDNDMRAGVHDDMPANATSADSRTEAYDHSRPVRTP